MENENKMEKNIESKGTVRAVERSLDILNCFIQERELSLTEISKKISLHKSTVFRLLNTLEQKGYLMRNNETDKYKLGYRILELSTNLVGLDDPATLFLPEMNLLREKLDETISLYVRDGLERIRVQSVESEQAIRRVAPVGARLPLSVGAASKILITYEEPNTRVFLLNRLEEQYQIDRAFFDMIINDIEAKGYATSFEEREIGAVAISFPVFSRSKKMIAALAVSGPVNRLTSAKLEEIAPIVKESAIKMGNMINK